MRIDTFLEFLRYCIGDEQKPPVSAKGIDWMEMMAWAESQAIVGVVYQGILKGGKELEIPFDALMEWVGYAQQIEAQNRLVNQRCVEIAAAFQKDGFETCILKGQGNAALYPSPLLRNPGDIDLWVRRQNNDIRQSNRLTGSSRQKDIRTDIRQSNDERQSNRLTSSFRQKDIRTEIKEIIGFVKERNPEARALYHHIDLGEFKGVEVEVHYRPSFLSDPVHNRRLQKWFRCHTESTDTVELTDGVGRINVPNWEFNVVFQLSHVYNHLLHEGIGLRQIIDYYYLLRQSNDIRQSNRLTDSFRQKNDERQNNRLTDSFRQKDIRTEIGDTLRYLGLWEIAGAMMWVLNEVLGLEEKYLIAPKDERRGRLLLAEIMKGGNFGFYDVENQRADSQLKKNWLRIRRDLRMMRYFPSECLWEPVFRVYHFFWRMAH